MASSTTTPPHIVEDCRGIVRVYSDGTIVRSDAPIGPTAEQVPADPTVEWKDAVYDAERGLHLRVIKPMAASAAGEDGKKLPVVVYYHGGGYCIGSFAWPTIHAACTRLAAALGTVVVSADYRLAPEHRLPAAIDDAAAVLLWLRDQAAADPWLADRADLGRVFVAGESAGGNMAYHMNLRFSGAAAAAALLPVVRLRGFVLLQPFFSGVEPAPSELSCPDGAFITPDLGNRYIRLCLPAGATADHPFLNPFSPEPDAPRLDLADVGPTLVVAAGDDILRDRNADYVRRMAAMGKPVELVEFPGQQHAFLSLQPWGKAADELLGMIKLFMDKTCSS